MLPMSVTCETFQPEMSPLKDESSNMPLISCTPDRSGASVALYIIIIMLPVPLKALFILVHCVSPHWSMDLSLEASA